MFSCMNSVRTELKITPFCSVQIISMVIPTYNPYRHDKAVADLIDHYISNIFHVYSENMSKCDKLKIYQSSIFHVNFALVWQIGK